MKAKTLVVIFFLIILQLSYSDDIRGQIKGITIIDPVSHGPIEEIILSSENIFAIRLTNEEQRPVRIQLEIRLSDTLRNNPNTFALFFYNNVTPTPAMNISNYTGSLVKYIVLQRRGTHFIDLYLRHQPSRNEIIPGTDVITPRDFKNSFSPIVIAMLPVMKGIPEHLLRESISVKVTPFYPDRGNLSIDVFERSNSPLNNNNPRKITDYRLFVDNRLIDNTSGIQENLILPIGIRRIRIEKDGYIPFEESFLVKNNEKNTLVAHLTRESPHVVIQAPPEAQIFINGVQHRQREFSNLGVGEHTFLLRLGEYSISRRINLEKGKRYLIDILLELDITEY